MSSLDAMQPFPSSSSVSEEQEDTAGSVLLDTKKQQQYLEGLGSMFQRAMSPPPSGSSAKNQNVSGRLSGLAQPNFLGPLSGEEQFQLFDHQRFFPQSSPVRIPLDMMSVSMGKGPLTASLTSPFLPQPSPSGQPQQSPTLTLQASIPQALGTLPWIDQAQAMSQVASSGAIPALMVDSFVKSESPQDADAKRRDRLRTPVACVPCHQGKASCDMQRPCGRCIKHNREHLCVNRVHNRKGRPPKVEPGLDESIDGSEPRKRKGRKQEKSERQVKLKQEDHVKDERSSISQASPVNPVRIKIEPKLAITIPQQALVTTPRSGKGDEESVAGASSDPELKEVFNEVSDVFGSVNYKPDATFLTSIRKLRPHILANYLRAEDLIFSRVRTMSMGTKSKIPMTDHVYRLVYDRMPFGIYEFPVRPGDSICHPEHIYVNQILADILGRPRKGIIEAMRRRATSMPMLFPPDQQERVYKSIIEAVARREVNFTCRGVMLHASGRRIPVMLSRQIRYDGDSPVSMVTFVQVLPSEMSSGL